MKHINETSISEFTTGSEKVSKILDMVNCMSRSVFSFCVKGNNKVVLVIWNSSELRDK